MEKNQRGDDNLVARFLGDLRKFAPQSRCGVPMGIGFQIHENTICDIDRKCKPGKFSQ
jgi:hypothetical protein